MGLKQIVAGAMLGLTLMGGCDCRDYDDNSPCCAKTTCGDDYRCETVSQNARNSHCVHISQYEISCCRCVEIYCNMEYDTDQSFE